MKRGHELGFRHSFEMVLEAILTPSCFTQLPNMQSRAQQQAHHTAQSTNREHDPVTGQEIEYWGVVVQTEEGSAADGCYVLKTVQNRDPAVDCTCVHYSLVSVCKGEPYSAQMASSWLI